MSCCEKSHWGEQCCCYIIEQRDNLTRKLEESNIQKEIYRKETHTRKEAYDKLNDEFKESQQSGFWGRSCARLSKRIGDIKKVIDKLLKCQNDAGFDSQCGIQCKDCKKSLREIVSSIL